jgi:hypothetical protein
MPATQPLRQAPGCTAPGEGETDRRVGLNAIIEARGKARGVGGEVVVAEASRIAVGVACAAIGGAPHAELRRRSGPTPSAPSGSRGPAGLGGVAGSEAPRLAANGSTSSERNSLVI